MWFVGRFRIVCFLAELTGLPALRGSVVARQLASFRILSSISQGSGGGALMAQQFIAQLAAIVPNHSHACLLPASIATHRSDAHPGAWPCAPACCPCSAAAWRQPTASRTPSRWAGGRLGAFILLPPGLMP